MPNGQLNAALCRGQPLFAEMNAVTPSETLGSVHVRAAVVDEVTFRRIRDPCLFQSLGDCQDQRPTNDV